MVIFHSYVTNYQRVVGSQNVYRTNSIRMLGHAWCPLNDPKSKVSTLLLSRFLRAQRFLRELSESKSFFQKNEPVRRICLGLTLVPGCSRDSLKGTIFSSELLVFLQMFSSSDSGTLGKLTLGQFGAPFSIYNHIYINVNYVFQDCSNCALWYLKALSACCHQLDRIGQNWTIQMWGESSFRLHDSVKFGLNIQQLSSPSVFCWENIDSPRFVRQFQALDNGLTIHGESG